MCTVWWLYKFVQCDDCIQLFLRNVKKVQWISVAFECCVDIRTSVLRYKIGKTREIIILSRELPRENFRAFSDYSQYVSDRNNINRDSGWPDYMESCDYQSHSPYPGPSLGSISMGRCWQGQSRVEVSAPKATVSAASGSCIEVEVSK